MSEASLSFEITPALMAFRQVSGNANRFLNTQLVALETLKTATPVRPPDLVLPWTLPAANAEWIETRHFTLRSTIVAVVDGLDRYLRVLTRIPGLVAEGLHDDLNGRRRPKLERRPTLFERVASLCGHYPKVVPAQYVFAIELLATWRNRFVHRSSKDTLSHKARKGLLAKAGFFKKEHGGADIAAAIARFDAGEPPNLSDLSTLIACTHRLVTALDEHLLLLQDGSVYAVSLMRFLIEEQADPSAYLENAFQYGGKRSAGHVHALFLHNGGNHDERRRANAPLLTRKKLNAILGLGRNDASALFGIPRPS
ncbi:hypothetical protein V1282_006178 [Nitrobacteraceae bacterium AZCC 2146]